MGKVVECLQSALQADGGSPADARDISSQGNNNTCLHIACDAGHIQVVRALACDLKADVNLANDDGHTALHVAVLNEYVDIAKVLIESKADLDCADTTGDTVRDIIRSSSNPELLALLIN